ncbi:MAG: SPOR domain-containing protein [Acidiferrobacterales bacterium]|nr:SPOR domain-containing protein [Acidiferrobacterales bacterium]
MQTIKKYSILIAIPKIIFLVIAMLSIQTLTAEDLLSNQDSGGFDYSAGMQAYMLRDFESSQKHWLRAAKQNHARSMFNLGLLHEQRKIASADIEKAMNWYRLAGKHGYPAADYHLAKLVENDVSSEEVIALLTRAAEANFLPAKQVLEQRFPDAAVSGVGQDKNTLRNTSVDSDLESNSNNNYLSEESIAKKPSTDWTIQILAFEDKNRVQEFIDQHQLKSKASYFADGSQGSVLYKLIYGSYRSKQEAQIARDRLPKELQEHGPWLRTVASIQELLSAN